MKNHSCNRTPLAQQWDTYFRLLTDWQPRQYYKFKPRRLSWICCLLLVGTSVVYAQGDVRTFAEQMPYFAGCADDSMDRQQKRACSEKSLLNFITAHLSYPEDAKKFDIEGTVVVQLVVDETGKINQPEVVYDIGGGCGAAALEMLSLMPAWQPALQDGQPVAVQLTLPIHFAIRPTEPDETEAYQLAWGTLAKSQVTRREIEDNLSSKIYVRDRLGNNMAIDEIIFAYERNDKLATARSRAGVNDEMTRLVSKLKKDGTFNITASVQDNGKFFYINRSYTILE